MAWVKFYNCDSPFGFRPKRGKLRRGGNIRNSPIPIMRTPPHQKPKGNVQSLVRLQRRPNLMRPQRPLRWNPSLWLHLPAGLPLSAGLPPLSKGPPQAPSGPQPPPAGPPPTGPPPSVGPLPLSVGPPQSPTGTQPPTGPPPTTKRQNKQCINKP